MPEHRLSEATRPPTVSEPEELAGRSKYSTSCMVSGLSQEALLGHLDVIFRLPRDVAQHPARMLAHTVGLLHGNPQGEATKLVPRDTMGIFWWQMEGRPGGLHSYPKAQR